MLKQFIAISICFFLSPHIVIAQSPPIVLDSLENRLVLLYLYNAQDFTDDGIALWMPDSIQTQQHPEAVKQKVSYTKIYARRYSKNQCVIIFSTLNIESYLPHSGLENRMPEYFDKAIFVKNNANQWTLQSFGKLSEYQPKSNSTVQVECLSNLSSENILTTLYRAEMIADSTALYYDENLTSNQDIFLYAKTNAKVYLEKISYYQDNDKDYALVIVGFNGNGCHPCASVASLTRLVKDADCGWRILNHNRFWGGEAQWGNLPYLEISSLKINGIDTKVIISHSEESGQGESYNYLTFHSLNNDFQFLFSYQDDYSNGGREYNDNIENLLQMDYASKTIIMKNTADYDFKLVYYKNGIYQKTEFYTGFKLEKNCTCPSENENFRPPYHRHLSIDYIHTDSVYTFEYISQYSGIPLEIFHFLNETPPSKEDPDFLTPFYLHEYFYLLFDKNKNFDLEKISKEYDVSIEQIQCINKYSYYNQDKFKDHFLLIPKKN